MRSGTAKVRHSGATGDGWLGVLCALPALALAWPGPGAFVRSLFEPEIAAAGIALIASLPALGLALRRRVAPHAAGTSSLLVFALACAVSLLAFPPTDTLHADRARMVLAAGFALFLAAATLGESGKLALARAAAIASLAYSLAAFLDGAGRYSGVLGNTGATSEAALAGAVAGAWLFANSSGAWRWIGLTALFSHALYSGLAPVWAGAVALAAGLAATLAFARGSRRALALALGLALLAFATGRALASGTPIPEQHPAAPAGPVVARDVGGVHARLLIWSTLPRYFAEHWALGAGPGQFRASYPPYRDPAELDLERAAMGADVETEVEHAHNDFLQGFSEAGFFGGAVWLVFLLTTAWNARRALRRSDTATAALGAAAVALLVDALVRAPLLWNAASSSLFFACAGAIASVPGALPFAAARLLLWFALVLVLVHAPRAVTLVRAAWALGSAEANPERALFWRSDSPLALALEARAVQQRRQPAAAAGEWRELLRLRPHSFEARMQLGVLAAAAERDAEARYELGRALALDPHHPRLLFDLALLALRHGDPGEVDAALDRMESAGALDRAALGQAGAREILAGRQAGIRFLERAHPELAGLSADALAERASALRKAGDALVADGLECYAQREFARGHVRENNPHDAVRSYRQALRLSGSHLPGGALPLQLEFAAALALDGQLEDARAELVELAAHPEVYARAEPWVLEALSSADLIRDP